MPTRAMTPAEGTDIEQTIRQVLGDVLNEVSEELSSGMGESPTNGRTSRPSARRAARGGPGGPARPSPNLPPDGGEAIPPEVEDAVEAVLRDLSPKQAQTLASLFDAIGDQEGEGEEEEEEEAPGMAALSGAELELSSMNEARAQGRAMVRAGGPAAVAAIVRMIMRNPTIRRAAVRAARAGVNAFKRWAQSLSNFNPIKWAIRQLPSHLLLMVVNQLTGQERGARGATVRGAAAGDVEPEDIEDVVRRVLSEALTEPQQGAPAH